MEGIRADMARAERDREPTLQDDGDGLLDALAAGDRTVEEAAARCAERLRERDWDGDEQLAAALEAALGTGPVQMLRPVPADLDALSELLEGDPSMNEGGWLDLSTGETFPKFSDHFLDEEDEEAEEERHEDRDRWRWVACEGSSDGYEDMVLFASTRVASERLARDLEWALHGRGAFRRFRDVLDRYEQFERWRRFELERKRGRARAWLATEGLKPAVPRPHR